MAKQSISIKDTKISNGGAYGNQIEQTVSVDDNLLPAPQELAEYQRIEPKIVEFLIKSSEREQLHRHKQDEKKLKILSYNEHKVGRMNWWGMFFAFLAIVVTMNLAAFALYLDRAWFAGIFGLVGVVSIASVFINNKKV